MPKQYHKNPRQITEKQFKDLRDSLKRLGDLSGIVHNIRTDEIIGGNQRSKAIDLESCEIVLEREFDEPDEQGTVALGHVIWQGHNYAYRAVVWDDKTAEEANIRANKAGGTWDFEALANEWDTVELIEWGFEPWEFGLDSENDFDPQPNDTQPRLDQKNPVYCPHCGENIHDEQS